MKKTSLIVGSAVALAALIVGAYFVLYGARSALYDARLEIALTSVEHVVTYEALVDTQSTFSDRNIAVSGLYKLDFNARRFGSFATTTLFIPTEKPGERSHQFTLSNISIGDDIYVKIDTTSPLLEKTIPHGPTWHRFSKTTIPKEFTNIAVSGPVLDNLEILSGHGHYLSLQSEPVERTVHDERLYVYEFTLSPKAATVAGGTLQSLIERIQGGAVELWLSEEGAVRILSFSGENYTSTTTILSVNNPVSITEPEVVE